MATKEWAYFIPGYATAWRNIQDDPPHLARATELIHETARMEAERQGYRLLAFKGDAILPASPAYRDGDGVRWTWDAEALADE